MVEQAFIDKLKNVLDALVKSRGAVSMFAALKMDDWTDKWSIIVAAPWVRQTTFESVFDELRTLLIEQLGDDMNTVARIGIFNDGEHFTKLMLDKYKTGDVIREDQQVNGNLVHSGVVVYANVNAHIVPTQGRMKL